MCNYRLLILFLFSFFIAVGAKAQKRLHYFFQHVTQTDGLLPNQVFSIVQDNKGFIWIVTLNGLQRYDGSRFVHYPEMLNDPAEEFIPGVEMYADKKNNLLWIQKIGAIKKMELGNNRFSNYDSRSLLKDTSFHYTSYRGAVNTTWLLGTNAIYFYDSSTKKYIDNLQNIVLPDAHKTAYVFTDSINKQTWAAMLSKVFLFDEKTKMVYSDDFNPIAHPLLQSLLYNDREHASRFVLADSKNNIWVTTWGNQLYRYNTVTKKMKTYLLSAVKSVQQNTKASPAGLLVNCMIEDNHSNIWLATENAGLLRYNRGEDNFDYCIAEEKNNESIQYNYKIFSLLQDKEQNIWIGTDKGINIFNPYRQYFKTIRHEENNPLSIPKSEIESFIQTAAGDIFIGTWGNGIAVYDSNFNFKKNILFKDPAENNFVWSFQQIDANTLWIGCQHGYLTIYNITTGAAKTLHPPEMDDFTIRCMEKDNKGNIWFGLHNGKIVKWDKAENKFLPYGADTVKKMAPVIKIFFDKQEHCWVSTEAGFKEFDPDKRIYINTWLPDKNNHLSISAKTCQGIEEYNDSTLLIGTIYGGINFFNKRTKAFTALTTTDGFHYSTIYAIKKDDSGFIWFTTDYGLYKFNPADRKIIPYSIEAGITNSSFKSPGFYTLLNGEWLTLTATEAISFYPPNAASSDQVQTKIEITGFKILNTSLFIDSLLLKNEPVELSYKNNFITIEFAALNFLSLQQTNYYYRLVGLEKDWVNGGTKRFANYTGLQPGEYHFEVKAETGNTSSAITTFKIIITPPFWKTWWFIAIIILCIVVLSFWLVKWREKNIKEIAAEKLKVQQLNAEAEQSLQQSKIEMYSMNEQLLKAKLEALRSQMNPHFIFNSLNAIDNLIQTNQKDKATTYLARFAKLIRNVLDSSKNDVVAFQKDYETLQLYLQMEQFRCSDKFSYELFADDELLHSDYKVPALIAQPFVENAIHHGLLNKQSGERRLTISVTLETDCIKYTVCDNGVGRAKAQQLKAINKPEHISYGIDITKERIQLYNQNEANNSVTITDIFENGEPSGTMVEIRVKIL